METPGNVSRLTGHIGAEISGVDITRLDTAGTKFVRDALLEHQVVFLPHQDMTIDAMVSFAERLGDVQPNPSAHLIHPENSRVIIVETNEGAGSGKYNEVWHSDASHLAKPPAVTVLHAVKTPDVGGDTLFASLYAAYDALSEPLKRVVEGLDALHDGAAAYTPILMDPLTESGPERLQKMHENQESILHPVVRRHPETGRKALYVNRTYTTRFMGLSSVESRKLLNLLFEHAEQAKFQVRWRWTEGDLAIWDNRSVMHYAAYDFGEAHRRMHRIFISGDRPSRT